MGRQTVKQTAGHRDNGNRISMCPPAYAGKTKTYDISKCTYECKVFTYGNSEFNGYFFSDFLHACWGTNMAFL